MSDTTRDFFERLARRGHEPLFETTTATIRFVLEDGPQTERWLVSLHKGDVEVSHRSGNADCTVRSSKDVFGGVARGEVNAMTALLRGALAIEGDSKILVRFQRLFPAPPAKAEPPRTGGRTKRR